MSWKAANCGYCRRFASRSLEWKAGVEMKNTWSKMIALIAVAVVLLSGCGETKVSEPYVVEQMYSLAHKPEQVFRHTDDIIVGTVLSLESQKLFG